MCTRGVWVGDGWDWGVLLVCDEVVDVIEDVSTIYELGLLEGVTRVTLRVWVVIVVWDKEVEGRLGAEGEVSEEDSRKIVQWRQSWVRLLLFQVV